MTTILLWVAAGWVLAMVLVFSLLGMSSKQDRGPRDEQVEAAVRTLRQRWQHSG